MCDGDSGGYVHWGATTQNITQTGKLLLLRKAHQIYLSQLSQILTLLADLAEKTKDYALPGRTHGQHAVPATFGYKVAVWIDELCRHVERLRGCEGRVFVAMLGGGAGTLASLAIGLAANGTALPMVATIAASGVLACLVAFSAFPKPEALLHGEPSA